MNLKRILVSALFLAVAFLANAQTTPETVTLTTEISVATKEGLSMDIASPIATFKSAIYYVYVDPNLNGCIAKSINGVVTSTIFRTNVRNDPHNVFSVGIDAEGYIHIVGDMHQDPMRYYRSKKPEDISEFDQLDGNESIGGIYGPNG